MGGPIVSVASSGKRTLVSHASGLVSREFTHGMAGLATSCPVGWVLSTYDINLVSYLYDNKLMSRPFPLVTTCFFDGLSPTNR